MNRAIRLLPVLLLLACGDPEPARPDFRPEDVLMNRAEWYPVARDTIPEVRVRVTGPDNGAVEGATVRQFVMPRRPYTPPAFLSAATTDAEGRCVFRDLPVNAWLLAEKEGFAAGMVPPFGIGVIRGRECEIRLRVPGQVEGVVRGESGEAVPNTGVMAGNEDGDWIAITRTDAEGRFQLVSVPAGVVSVHLVPGEYLGRSEDIELPQGGTRKTEIVAIRTPVMAGRVVEEATGAPVAGAVVRTLAGDDFESPERFVLTEKDGRFRIPGAHTGGLYIHADGYGEARLNLPPDQPRDDITVKLSPAMEFSGRVVDSKGMPVAGARVSAYPRPEKPGPFARGPVTKADGTFSMTWAFAPPEGATGVLLAESPGCPLGLSEPLEFRRGGRRDGVEILLLAPSAFSCRLVDETGSAWANVPVTFARTSETWPAGVVQYAGGNISVFTDSEGRLDFRTLRPGEHRLTANVPRRLPFENDFMIGVEARTDAGDVVIPRGSIVSGRILDTASAPVSGISALLMPEGGGRVIMLQVDEDGSFRLTGLDAGRYFLKVDSQFHEPLRRLVEAKPEGEAEEAEVVLNPLVRLDAVLTGLPESHPGGFVRIVRSDGPREARILVTNRLAESIGTTDFGNLPRGRYRLIARVGEWCGTVETRIERSSDSRLEIPMERGAILVGRLLDAAGGGIDGATVEVDAGEIGGQWTTTSGEGGRFRIEGLVSGEVTLRSHPQGYPEGAVVAVARGAATVEVDIVLPEAAILEIRAATPAGAPVPDLKVWLRDEDGEVEPVWVDGGGPANTNHLGLVKLVGIRSGVYTLHVSLGPDVIERRRIRLSPGQTLSVPLEVSR